MGMTQLVDVSLLGRFLSKVKLLTARKTASIPMGAVDATSTDTVFTAQVDGITELRDGVCMWLQNGVVTSASGFTINVNNLGAKPVYGSLAAATRSTTLFNVSYTMLFIYNSTRVSGGCWDAVYGYDSNTNTIGYQLRTNSTSLPVSGATYRYRLLFTSADGTQYVPANTSTSTNATATRTVNQTPIDPFGPIRYYSNTTAISAGSRPGASYIWEQYNITLGYSFNRTGAALTLTSWMPVYVKCTPLADGSAVMDSATPYVQQLPSSDDGKIYIFLGIATAATTVELVPEHPVYCYRDGGIQRWTGLQTEVDSLKNSFSNLESSAITVSNIYSYGSTINDALYDTSGINVPLIIAGDGDDGDTVYLQSGRFDTVSGAITSCAKVTFAFAIPTVAEPSNLSDFHFLCMAQMGDADFTNQTLEFTGIGNGTLYSVVLSNVPGQTAMTGTLSVNELTLPIVDEEEF